jgi:hypothetical protein
MEPPQYNGGLLDLQKREYLATMRPFQKASIWETNQTLHLFRLLSLEMLHRRVEIEKQGRTSHPPYHPFLE